MRVSFLRPIDQFYNVRRFLDELKDCLLDEELTEFRFAVAFAKSGPLLRLAPLFQAWKQNGKTVEAILGIDLQGTSKQALLLALQTFDKTYLLHSNTHATFHPKIYLFSGPSRAICYQGSHNLTVGGTETNLEAGVRIEIDRITEEETFAEALSAWTTLLPEHCAMTVPLDNAMIDKLLADKIIFDENVVKPRNTADDTISPDGSSAPILAQRQSHGVFKRIFPVPPSAIPRQLLVNRPERSPRRPASTTSQTTSLPASTVATEALVIQIVPHHNGEVFLSKQAVDQNQAFFGFPFSGVTTPKFARNASYPQRIPDPVVNVTVYDASGNVALMKAGYAMNTVYYSTKSEIRVTFSPDLRVAVAPMSIMVMRRTEEAHDYDIDIFNPGEPPSDRYMQYLSICNQQLPSGGSDRPRRMGWL